jgi:hypothetical protein
MASPVPKHELHTSACFAQVTETYSDSPYFVDTNGEISFLTDHQLPGQEWKGSLHWHLTAKGWVATDMDWGCDILKLYKYTAPTFDEIERAHRVWAASADMANRPAVLEPF